MGQATPNPDGSVGFGLHVVTVPGGRTIALAFADGRLAVRGLGDPLVVPLVLPRLPATATGADELAALGALAKQLAVAVAERRLADWLGAD